METREENGFVLMIVLVAILPLALFVTAFSSIASRSSSALRDDLDGARAMLAAEAGIDSALYQGRIGILYGGETQVRQLAGNLSFEIVTVDLGTDNLDNDGDRYIDEADEAALQITSTGTYGATRRRLVTYAAAVPLLPQPTGAVTIADPNATVELNAASLISGHDTALSGTASGSLLPGVTTSVPGATVETLRAQLGSTPHSRIVGAGAAPSLDANPSAEPLTPLTQRLREVADTVLTRSRLHDIRFGSIHRPALVFRSGDATFTGHSGGVGVLVVTGNLTVNDDFQFDGIVIALGEVVNTAGSAIVRGAVFHGPTGHSISATSNLQVIHSHEAITLANSRSGRFVAINGWQEVAAR